MQENDKNYELVGKVVEIHLLKGKRFLGKVRRVDPEGLTLTCVPIQVLETMPDSVNMKEQVQGIISTLFFPLVGVEYVDIGGEPVGFDTLYASWLNGKSIDQFFDELT